MSVTDVTASPTMVVEARTSVTDVTRAPVSVGEARISVIEVRRAPTLVGEARTSVMVEEVRVSVTDVTRVPASVAVARMSLTTVVGLLRISVKVPVKTEPRRLFSLLASVLLEVLVGLAWPWLIDPWRVAVAEASAEAEALWLTTMVASAWETEAEPEAVA